MAKKVAKTTQFTGESIITSAGAAPKKAAASRTAVGHTTKHIKSQASGVVAAVEGFVSAIATNVLEPRAAASEIETIAPVSAPAPAPTHEEIAKLAYCFYMDRQGQNGTQAEDWLRAEQVLSAR